MYIVCKYIGRLDDIKKSLKSVKKSEKMKINIIGHFIRPA